MNVISSNMPSKEVFELAQAKYHLAIPCKKLNFASNKGSLIFSTLLSVSENLK